MVKAKENQPKLAGGDILGDKRGNAVVLVIAAMDMSWRLAIAVLVPVIGGFELDKHLGTEPALTILGFLLAMAGVFLIMKQAVAKAGTKVNRQGSGKADD